MILFSIWGSTEGLSVGGSTEGFLSSRRRLSTVETAFTDRFGSACPVRHFFKFPPFLKLTNTEASEFRAASPRGCPTGFRVYADGVRVAGFR